MQAAEVIRDENGYWWHPDLPDYDYEDNAEDYKKWIREQKLEFKYVYMEDDLDDEDPRYKAYFEDGEPGVSDWTVPTPEGWFVYAITDCEDGPVFIFARVKP